MLILNTLGLPELVIITVLAVLVVLPASRICVKAGYPAWLGALAILPVLNAVLGLLLAFAKWPIEQELEAVNRAGRST